MRTDLSLGRLIGGIALLVLIGTPLVAYLWETLNQTAAGYYDPLRLVIAVPVLLAFVVFVRFLARLVVRWDRHQLE
jgi:hypothetical protein